MIKIVVDCEVVDVMEEKLSVGGGDGISEDEIEVLVFTLDCGIVGVVDEIVSLSVADAVTDVLEALGSVVEALEDDVVDVALFLAAIMPLS